MSSNFPMVPAGIPLPSVPQSNGELLGWASGITRAIQHLNRVMSSRLFDVLLQGPQRLFQPFATCLGNMADGSAAQLLVRFDGRSDIGGSIARGE